MNKPWYKKWWGILILFFSCIFFSLIFAFALYVFNLKSALSTADGAVPKNIVLPKEITGTEANYWLGAAKPKITIVEFGDFACAYCHKSFPKIREINEKYRNDIKYIWRDYPLISDFSDTLALSARCAGEQGLFWPMHDKLFLNQGITTEAEVQELFKQIGGDETRFLTCVKNNKYLKDIEQDVSDGQSLKITGTPTWFINGKRIEGDIPYEFLINLINSIKE